jgi:hypothetical protein
MELNKPALFACDSIVIEKHQYMRLVQWCSWLSV